MPRALRLIRRVVASGGGWAGDPIVWTEANPPVSATVDATELTDPTMEIALARADARPMPIANRGAAGYLRVLGADAARRFDMEIYLAMTRVEAGSSDEDWNRLKGSSPVDIGNGEDFTTDPAWLQDARIAFHLVPKGGNLASGSTVELWAAEI